MWQPAHTRAFRWRFGSPSGDGAAAWRREQPAPARATSRAAAVASFRGMARGTSLIFAPSYAPLNGCGPRTLGHFGRPFSGSRQPVAKVTERIQDKMSLK